MTPFEIEIFSGPHIDGTYTYVVRSGDAPPQRYHQIPTLAVLNSPEWSDAYHAYRVQNPD
jgi:hypothetical protein